jgi:ribosomal-protein-alanine N-acetyltransferase
LNKLILHDAAVQRRRATLFRGVQTGGATVLTFNFSPFPIFETPRLILRPLGEQDLEPMFELRTDAEVSRYIDRFVTVKPDDVLAFIHKIEKGLADNLWVYWAITKKGEDKLIGTVCLWNLVPGEAKAELGYELSTAAQGKGYMKEALEAVLAYGFGPMGLKSIDAGVHPENLRSLALLERTGFEPGGTFADTFLTGESVVMKIYKLSKRDFEEQQEEA